MPRGKAIALAAMPTAVLMGMGFTPTLALADGDDGTPPANSLTAEEYKACMAALEEAEEKTSASPEPSASASASGAAGDGKDDTGAPDDGAKGPDAGDPEVTDPDARDTDVKDTDKGTGSSSSSDSGSDDKAGPGPAPSASQQAQSRGTASPSPSESRGGGLLDGLGDAIEGIFTGGAKTGESPAPAPSASASESASEDASGTVEDTTGKPTGTAGDVEDTTGAAGDTRETAGSAGVTRETAEKAAEATKKAVEKAKKDKDAGDATASPDPSGSASADPEDCPVATDAEGGVDNPVLLPDEPWRLNASSLTLKGASYKGIVEVRTANGTTKKVLKYVVSDGTDIGDLHQTVKDEASGKTYHVQAAKGSKSTITGGDTVMYTESISGNLLGLIPLTFDPEHPPPLDIPLIYFTKVTVVQAGQFGGTLHIPGLQQYVTG
ncbi:hypothetical protein [Streptomyces sp. AC627_RSS907]|uniref:hypothetical protein n=1 Tax=Streptomyces sp. AC627_RSS907 TaxID=2823684 RepID=UPI0020B8729E|nr:hypothetical protein [Streptomyces sp. AC627_RSS907]